MSTSIASSFSSCLGAYQDLVAALSDSSEPLRDEISLSDLEDELGRLKVWAGNIAAHKVGRASLDFRLRDASPLRDRIIGLLQDMESLLREAIPIITGDRKPQDEAASDTDSSDDDNEGIHRDQLQHRTTTELQQTFLDIVDIIDCLYKLSITIRNPSPHDRLVKAASVDTSFYEHWDIQHVRNKFPTIKEYLAVRLGKAISRRRQFLQYREKHRKKLGQYLASLVPRPKSASGKQPLKSDTQVTSTMHISLGGLHDHAGTIRQGSEAEPSIVATTVLTQTTASEFYGGNAEFEVESDSGQTQTSYATSVGNEGSLSIPPLPKEAQGGRPFECQYCFTIVSIRNSRSWRKHILRDLQPYVCTFESCNKGSKIFDSRHAWFDHELLNHRKEWVCTVECQKSFNLQSDFEDHMRQTHASTFSEHQLAALVDMCQQTVDEDSETQCPLCIVIIGSTKQLCRHLARHLEALAIFALPRNRDEEKEEDGFGSDRVQLSDASRGLSDGTLSFSSKSQSASEDSELNVKADIHDEISGFLNDFTDSEKLPPSFAQLFQQQFRDFLDTGQDSIVLQIFKDVGEVILGPDFQQLLDSESSVRDLVSLFYLEATTSCEKHQIDSDGLSQFPVGLDSRPIITKEHPTHGAVSLLDEAAALFVQLMARTLAAISEGVEQPGLVLRLEGLRNKLLARSSRRHMLRETRAIEEPEFHDETDRLLNPDWAKCWGIREAELEELSDQEITRQQNIHAIWTSERTYLEGLDTLMTLYRDDLIDDPSITEDGKRLEFVENIFAKVENVRKMHAPLLVSLRTRLLQQGPLVESLSGIFMEWARPEVREAYFEYAKQFPSSEVLILNTMKKNPQFKRAFDKETARMDWLRYLKNPMDKILHLLIALRGIDREETEASKKKQDDIYKMQYFYSSFESYVQMGVARASRTELAGKLVLAQGMENIELNLEDEARQLFYKGDIIRRSANSTLLINLACLFDNYFILSAPVQRRYIEDSAESETVYEVKKMPIPMSLLLLEDSNEKPTALPEWIKAKDLDARLLFPFRIKHLGKSETYTLYTKSQESRDTWREQIVAAIEAHTLNEELKSPLPFSLKIIADTAFQPREHPKVNRTVMVKGSALDKAIQTVPLDHQRKPLGTRMDITCATMFLLNGAKLVAVGTDEGFSVCVDHHTPGGWKGLIRLLNVKQIHFIEEHKILVVLTADALSAYPAIVVCDYCTGNLGNDPSDLKAPIRTEIAKSVEFFEVGRMKERDLLIYAKKDGLSTTFKVLEPIYYKAAKKKGNFFSLRSSKAETYDMFREFDEFYISSECFGINMFNQWIAVSTMKGIELLALDRKIPISVPDLSSPSTAPAARLQGQRPLGMFRLPAEEFFCAYEETGIYLDKHGEVSRSTVIEFVGRAKKAALVDQYIVLFHDDFVEIRDVWNGRLRQIIAGENVRCLDDAQGLGNRSVLIVMAYPELEDRQLVLELRLEKTEDSEA